MELLSESEFKIIEKITEITTSQKLDNVEYKFVDKFLNDNIGLNYIGNILRSIDNNLYYLYKLLLKNNKFMLTDNCKATDSVNLNIVYNSMLKDTAIIGPHINSPFDLFAVSHEVGHALSNYRNIGNQRNLYNKNIYSETISILFGKLCELKYIKDFGIDNNVLAFEILNVNNALNCIERVKKRLNVYKEYLEKINIIGEPKNFTQRDKLSELKYKIEKEKNEIIKLISYSFGISFLNSYLNLNMQNKDLYLKMVTKYILTEVPFDYKIILDVCNISFQPESIKDNILSYVEDVKSKTLSIRGN